MQDFAVRGADAHPPLAADPFDFAALQPRQGNVACAEHGEFQAG
jgi:hypothetical protein